MSIFSLVLYIALQIAFIPLALLGGVLVAYRQMVVSKKLGVSQTAIEVLNGRLTMHIFGIRDDEPSAQLAAVLPNTSVIGLWLVLLPLWLTFRISGKHFLYPRVPEVGAERLLDLVVARTLYFDRIIERVIGEVEQFVVMGAGYDPERPFSSGRASRFIYRSLTYARRSTAWVTMRQQVAFCLPISTPIVW